MASHLSSARKRYLKSAAHPLKPVVFIGRKGITDAVVRSLETALDTHELIKVKFLDFKEKGQKQELVDVLERRTGASGVGILGHIALFYREHPDPEKRKIVLPRLSEDDQ